MMKKRYPLLLCTLLFSTMHISLADAPYAQWQNGPPAEESYFPIGVWLQHPNNAPKYKNAGINLYIGLWQGPTSQQLATLKQHGMPVICHQNPTGLTHRDNDIIIGWLQQDEPDNAQPVTDPDTGEKSYGPPVPPKEIVARYDELKQKDPTRPVLLNLGQGVANDEWHGRGPGAERSDYLTYVKGGDIVSFDYYPIAGSQTPKGPDHLPLIAKGINRLQEWTKNDQITWNAIECTRIGDGKNKPTPHQVKAEVWISLIHGSNGIFYFVHEFAPRFNEDALLDDNEMREAVTQINRQIHDLAPVLNSPTLPNQFTVQSSKEEAPIATMLKEHNGHFYLFTVNMANTPTTATIQSHKNIPINVLGENRTITANPKKQFQDEYKPYGVHIYKFPNAQFNHAGMGNHK